VWLLPLTPTPCATQALASLFYMDKELGEYVLFPWYHGKIDRATGVSTVTSGGQGCFLVRASSRPGNLALQFVSSGGIKTTLLHNVGPVRTTMIPPPPPPPPQPRASDPMRACPPSLPLLFHCGVSFVAARLFTLGSSRSLRWSVRHGRRVRGVCNI